MTYTSNLQLLNSVAPTPDSGVVAAEYDTALAAFNSNIVLLDEYTAKYYNYNVVSDSNISITSNAIYINITDTNILLSTNKTLSISSTSVKQLRIVKNSTAYTLTYGSISITSQSIKIIYNDTLIGTTSYNIHIQDIYTYISGKPAINTILCSKMVSCNSILSGGLSKANIVATNTTIYDIFADTLQVGYITYTSGSAIGIVSVIGVVYINATQNLYVKTRGTQDATLADIGIVLNIIGE